MVPSSKRSSSCAFLKGKIYCFGRYLSAIGLEADTTLLVLDLNVPHCTSISNDWWIMSDAEESDILAREEKLFKQLHMAMAKLWSLMVNLLNYKLQLSWILFIILALIPEEQLLNLLTILMVKMIFFLFFKTSQLSLSPILEADNNDASIFSFVILYQHIY
jgi:hypothetical protein